MNIQYTVQNLSWSNYTLCLYVKLYVGMVILPTRHSC